MKNGRTIIFSSFREVTFPFTALKPMVLNKLLIYIIFMLSSLLHMISGRAQSWRSIFFSTNISFFHINSFTETQNKSKYLPEFHQKDSYAHMTYKIPLHSDAPKLTPKPNSPAGRYLLLHF